MARENKTKKKVKVAKCKHKYLQKIMQNRELSKLLGP